MSSCEQHCQWSSLKLYTVHKVVVIPHEVLRVYADSQRASQHARCYDYDSSLSLIICVTNSKKNTRVAHRHKALLSITR